VTTTSAPAAAREAPRSRVAAGALYSFALAAACYVSYWVTTHVLNQVHSVSSADDQLGGLWAVVATVFVYRTSYEEDVAAALSRFVATLLSFALCLVYLAVLPFSPAGLAVLIGMGTLILLLIGRPGEIVTTGITTAVVMVVAAVTPRDAWQQPILRLADTIVGIAIGIAAAWVALLAKGIMSGARHRTERP